MSTITNITVPTNIHVSYKVLGVKVGSCKATRKLAQDKAVAEVTRAVTRWFYSR